MLAERFRDFTRAELTALLDAAGVPCGPINAVPDVFADPQVQHRQMLRHLPHPVAGSVPQVVSPIRMQDAPLAFDRAPPTLGQHTAEVLAELGLDGPACDALAAKGIV
jgi:crotonobetainyl-CoA:carnitine CoA-transferase CaiB-like acyl-CoA transferase